MAENNFFESPGLANVLQLFDRQRQQTPTGVALQFRDKVLTYDDLDRTANRLANFLIGKNIQKDDLVGLCLERSSALGIAVLGIIKSGAAYVPFDPEYPAERIKYMLQVAQCKVIVTQKKFAHLFNDSGCEIIAWENEAEAINQQSDESPAIEITKDDLLYVLFTSGSTGHPKGVAMRHEPVVNVILWEKNETVLSEPARTLQFSPISFDVSFQEIFTTWATGGCLFMIDESMRINPLSLLKFINDNKIERLFLVFTALQQLCEIAVENKIFPSSLKDIITGGEQIQITKQIITFFKALPDCLLHNHYGPTETNVATAYTMEGTPDQWNALPPIGKPLTNVAVYLLDDNLYPVKRGDEGELYVGGTGVARNYLYRDDLTYERFINDSFSDHQGARMYRTGDWVKELPDGNLQFLGRKDGQVKISGYRIELGEIEVAIASRPGIKEVVVISREEQPGLKRLVAYLVPKENDSINVNDIRKMLSEKFPEYMIPSAFVQLKELPLTASGKIDRRNLPAPDTKRPELSQTYVAPATSLEKVMAKLWEEVLLIDNAGLNDSFFELGGNSLLALRFIYNFQKQIGNEIPVVKLYQYSTIKELCDYLHNKNIKLNVLEEATERVVRAAAGKNHESNILDDGIAIIGMSGRFPGAKNINQYWDNLVKGMESVTFFKPAELSPFISEDEKNDPDYVAARGIIEDADKFDAAFFNMNPRVAEITDPQQRIFIQLAWEALENAGYSSDLYNGLIGVFAGTGNNTYFVNNLLPDKDAMKRAGIFQSTMSNEKDYIATYSSYLLDLKGPAISIHTACSTSLVAIIHAVKSLREFDCDIAIAGGVAITSPVNSGHIYAEGAMYSRDGHTRSFDADASGTIFSDGGGVVALKRYKDAANDGDQVYAVIRGVGLNNDGHDKASFTAPSVRGQASVIAKAHADSGIMPETISYIEAHGTATPIGDPIEIEALSIAFRSQTEKKQFCAVGSIKSNFGHLTAAAGVAGIIKTALALKYRQLPPTINFDTPNPSIDFENSPFYVNQKLADWKVENYPRRAGVSSFGFGGTNAHVILEEAPESGITVSMSRPRQLLMLSAKTREALETMSTNLLHHLQKNKDQNIADVAYTLQTGRKYFNHKKILVVADVTEAIRLLQIPENNKVATRSSDNRPGVVFMFPGQSTQYENMGANLYRDEKVFCDAVDKCCDILYPLLGEDLRDKLYPSSNNAEAAALSMKETFYAQPALFVIEYALAQLWMSWGIIPKIFIGHSIGEFTAACLAGVMTLEDTLKLIAVRGRMMQDVEEGSMLSVRMSAGELEQRLPSELSIAADNGPQLCVVAGNITAINKLKAELEKEEITCRFLQTSRAFHSPMMDGIVEPFHKIVQTVTLGEPHIPIVSTVTAERLTDEEATDPMYWAKQLRATVQFAKGIQTLWKEDPSYMLLECGPRTTAATLARQQATDLKLQVAISSLGDNANDNAEWNSILYAIGQLWLNGVNVDWKKFYNNERRLKVPLPTYPFEQKRYWLDPPSEIKKAQGETLSQPHTQETPSLQHQNFDPSVIHQDSVTGNEMLQSLLLQQMQMQQQLMAMIIEESRGEDQ